MSSLLESFFDTMDELQGDFRRRLVDIERKAPSAPEGSAQAVGDVPRADRFDEIRDPLGLGLLWADHHGPERAEPAKKPFTSTLLAPAADEPDSQKRSSPGCVHLRNCALSCSA
ncbi:hypothetical protein ACVW0K_007005 [Streptomyces filamentosus]|uniref:hypothetical protein n=1 Tax=Streptomyces filamentosus TaxID=67294 RepID=UPI0036E76A27